MKVGETVRILKPYGGLHGAGALGEIVEIDEAGYLVKSGNRQGFYWRGELERVEPARTIPPFGVSPEELADYVGDYIEACRNRVLTVGAEQYSEGDSQKFEKMPILELIQYGREEAQDLAVYAAMIDIRLARMAEKLKEAGIQ